MLAVSTALSLTEQAIKIIGILKDSGSKFKNNSKLIELNDIIIALQQKIVALQQNILKLQAEHDKLQLQNSNLLLEKEDTEKWKINSKDYQLKEVKPGFFCYVKNSEEEEGDLVCWFCQNCFQNQKLSLIQQTDDDGKKKTYRCFVCDTKFSPKSRRKPMKVHRV